MPFKVSYQLVGSPLPPPHRYAALRKQLATIFNIAEHRVTIGGKVPTISIDLEGRHLSIDTIWTYVYYTVQRAYPHLDIARSG